MANPIPQVGGAVAAPDPAAAGAIRRYEERLARDPAGLTFAPLADAYRKVGRAREAIDLCRRGLARFPQYTTARLILARAYLDEGNAEAALGELELIVEASPRDAQAQRLAAEIHRKAGRRTGEGSPLGRVLEDDTFATVSFGVLCLEQGLHDEAAQIFLRIVKKNPGDAR